MLCAAAAGELDAEDGGMLRAGQLLEAAEARQPDVRLTVERAREGVRTCQRVIHLGM